MKEVIKAEMQVVVTTTLDKVDVEKYYGFSNRLNTGNFGFITREKYNEGKYRVQFCYCVTKGNQLVECSRDTLKETVIALLSYNLKVYEFDTFSDLFKWLGDIISN